MDNTMIVESFKFHFLKNFIERAQQAYQPGNTLETVLAFLEPFDLALALAEGADKVSIMYCGTISRQTATEINEYMETTTATAKSIRREWKDVSASVKSLAARGPLARLSSREAESGEELADAFASNNPLIDFSTLMLGRLFGGQINQWIERAKLQEKVSDLKQSFIWFIRNAHSRFFQDVLPRFEEDVTRFRG